MRRRLPGLVGMLTLIVVYWAQRVQVLQAFAWRFTDEDQALLAYVVREVQAGTPHAPTFYGQSYGNWIEAAVAAPFTPASVSPAVTLPVATQWLCWLPFVALALQEWRRGATGLSLTLLLIPCLLPHRADVLYSMPRAWLPGITVAMLGATLLRPFPMAMAASQMVGVTLNSAAGLLSIPVLVEAGMRGRRDRQLLQRLAAGVVLGALYPAALWMFDLQHPTYAIHPSPPWTWSPARMREGLSQANLLAGSLLPLTCALLALAVGVGRVTRSSLVALAVFAGLCLAAPGFEKVWDAQLSVFFPHERAFLALPYAGTWWLWMTLRERADTSSLLSPHRTILGTVSLLIALALTVKEATRAEALQVEVDRRMPSVVMPREVPSVQRTCDEAEALADRAGVPWVFFRQDRTAAYACGAEWYGRRDTLFPSYDRRQWLFTRVDARQVIVFEDEARRTRQGTGE